MDTSMSKFLINFIQNLELKEKKLILQIKNLYKDGQKLARKHIYYYLCLYKTLLFIFLKKNSASI